MIVVGNELKGTIHAKINPDITKALESRSGNALAGHVPGTTPKSF